MRLILHIGLNKAASTFIQDVFSHNVELLRSNGIAYPNPPKLSHDRGGTQAGNAPDFARSLADERWGEAETLFGEYVSLMGGVETLLLSTEGLYHQLIKPTQKERFLAICQGFGVSEVELVVIFRNIYSHAVSAFAHRAAHPAVPPFHEWIEPECGDEFGQRQAFLEVYELWNELPAFVDNVLEQRDWKVVGLFLGSDLIERVSDVLGVALQSPPKGTANVSVGLFEAEVLQRLKLRLPGVASEYRARAKELNQHLKVSDYALRNAYFDEIETHIHVIQESIRTLSEKLGLEGLDVRPPIQDDLAAIDIASTVVLSHQQLDVLIETIESGVHRRASIVQQVRRIASRRMPVKLKKSILRLISR